MEQTSIVDFMPLSAVLVEPAESPHHTRGPVTEQGRPPVSRAGMRSGVICPLARAAGVDYLMGESAFRGRAHGLAQSPAAPV